MDLTIKIYLNCLTNITKHLKNENKLVAKLERAVLANGQENTNEVLIVADLKGSHKSNIVNTGVKNKKFYFILNKIE